MTAIAAIDWQALEAALAWRSDEDDMYLDIETGEVVSFAGLEPELAAGEIDSGLTTGRLLPIEPLPSSDEYGWMEEFADTVANDFPNMLLDQDDDCTPVSDLMGRENHVFSVAPRSLVEGEMDWKLPVFEAGKYLVVFDGAALLMLELWKRGNRSKEWQR